jgi:hypothetical protein
MWKIKKLRNVVVIGNSTFFEDDNMKVTSLHRFTWSYTPNLSRILVLKNTTRVLDEINPLLWPLN